MTAFTGLTAQICQQAFDLILPSIQAAARNGTTNKLAGHFVVLNPAVPYEAKYNDATRTGEFDELVLWQQDINPNSPELAKYTAIAEAKALTSFQTGLPSHLVQVQYPSLYLPGMTKWGGSAVAGVGPVKLIVSFSGVQWNFDQMFSEWLLSAIQALCLQEMRAVMASENPMIS